ncbi:MFS transporter [Kibdelosporangium philippinense]|uniref:MFS transporter n=1 Tax=Kibdelosporangium philippinense TaxID=211113 RepID=A0ABS8ZC69_9PSEU|nr:MFS transporter [Kibdelosporangium philippinense]MCE7004128.1 MFS transporter [Kibdelosporangium philippinense]
MQLARQWKVLIVTSVAVFMALLDVTIVNVAFPDMRASFANVPLSDLSWVLNAYNVVFAAMLVPAGRLADRLGRKRTFLTGLVVFVAASVLCGAAPSVEVLIAARVVQAVGAAALVPISLSLVLPEFPPERRGTAVALSTMTGAIAAAAGPSLGGVLVSWQGWRWVFFVNLIVFALVFVPAVRLLRESSKDVEARWPDMVGAGLLALSIGFLALSLVKGEDWGWGSVRVVAGFAAAVGLMVWFVVRSKRHESPVFELSLFRSKGFSAANAGAFVFNVGFYAVLLCNILFLTGVWHYSEADAGLAVTPGPVVAALTAPFAGRLVDRFGSRAIAVPGGLVFGAGALWLSLHGDSSYLTGFLPGMLMTGLGVGLSIPSFTSAAVSQLPANRMATGTGITSAARQIGAVVGIAMLIAVVRVGYAEVYLVIAIAGGLAAVAASLVSRVPSPQ